MHLFAQHSGKPTGMERTARLALTLAARRVPRYDSRFSRKDFTRPQLLACVLLRSAYGLTFRGVCEWLEASPALREALGLSRTPHFTTVESCANAPGMEELVQHLLTELMLHIGGGAKPAVRDAAMDSTGLGATVASVYFEQIRREKAERAGRKRPGKQAPESGDEERERRYNSLFVKVSAVVLCGSLLPAAVIASMGRSNDNQQSHELVERMVERVKVGSLYADAGYDGEPLHERCRERHGIRSVIPPVIKTGDGSIQTKYRAQMRELPPEYARRRHVEAFFSALKRTTGPALRARRPDRLLVEATLRVLAYGIRR